MQAYYEGRKEAGVRSLEADFLSRSAWVSLKEKPNLLLPPSGPWLGDRGQLQVELFRAECGGGVRSAGSGALEDG